MAKDGTEVVGVYMACTTDDYILEEVTTVRRHTRGKHNRRMQLMQNTSLRNANGCKQDTRIQHLHDGTPTLPIYDHLQFHASQYKH